MMTKAEKSAILVIPHNEICIICNDEQATVYCRGCGGSMCEYCRTFGLHKNKICDIIEG